MNNTNTDNINIKKIYNRNIKKIDNKKNYKKYLIIGIILLVVIGLGIFLYLTKYSLKSLFTEDSLPTSTPTPEPSEIPEEDSLTDNSSLPTPEPSEIPEEDSLTDNSSLPTPEPSE